MIFIVSLAVDKGGLDMGVGFKVVVASSAMDLPGEAHREKFMSRS